MTSIYDLRLARPEENDIVSDFCALHRGQFLPVPDSEEIYKAAHDGYLFIVAERGCELTRNTLHACAGLFSLATGKKEDGSLVKVYETACTAINKETLTGLSPINLQQLLFSLRFAALAIHGPDNACLLTSIVEKNAGSFANAKHIGAIPIESPEWLRRCRRSWCRPGEEDDVQDFIIPPESALTHIDRIDAFLAAPTLQRINKKTQEAEEYHFVVDIPWATASRLRMGWHQGLCWETECPPYRHYEAK